MTKTFNPSMDLTSIFFLNKSIPKITFDKSNIKTTYDTDFKKHYNVDFKKKSDFKDDSKETINNDKVFRKTFYNNSKFEYDENKNEILNQWGLPNIPMRDFNPQYKYRYPKMTENELKIARWESEVGEPNALNQRIRSELNDQNIEDIREQDNIYQQGLETLKTRIREKHNEIQQLNNDINQNGFATKEDGNKLKNLETEITRQEKLQEKIKKNNPVNIKPAIEQLQEKIDTAFKSGKFKKNVVKSAAPSKPIPWRIAHYNPPPTPTTKAQPPPPPPPKPTTKAQPPPPVKTDDEEIKEVMDKLISDVESKNSSEQKKKPLKLSETQAGKERAKIIEEQQKRQEKKTTGILKELENELKDKKATKIQSLVRKNLAKKAVEEKRKSIDTSDEKTVIDDTSPEVETYKINVQGFKNLIKKFSALDDKTNIDELLSNDQVKLKDYMKAIGIPPQTKTLKGLRKKYSIL